MLLASVFLVFLVCTDPHHCREANGGKFDSIAQCAVNAQPTAAKWLGDHPAYSILRDMTCGPEPADEGQEL